MQPNQRSIASQQPELQNGNKYSWYIVTHNNTTLFDLVAETESKAELLMDNRIANLMDMGCNINPLNCKLEDMGDINHLE